MKEFFVNANGQRLCVRDYGRPSEPAVLLIMGLACQMTYWPDKLINELRDKGYRVICFDNRDIGLSSGHDGGTKHSTLSIYLRYRAGLRSRVNYTLFDMAKDAVGLLEEMEIDQAHVVGASMGGMIGQIMAAKFPDRVASLTALISSNNHPNLPLPEFKIMWRMYWGQGLKNESDVEKTMNFWRLISSPDYPTPEKELRQRIEMNHARSYRPGGVVRQTQAILATGSLRHLLKRISAPTVVVHGDSDPLLKVDCAHSITKHIRNAKLEVFEGMGHDLPDALLPHISVLIDEHIQDAVA